MLVRDVFGSETGHTSARTTGRVEVVGRVSGRRNWSDEVLQRRELSSGLVYTWRKQARLGLLGGMAPALPAFAEVRVAEVEPVAPAPQSACEAGFIHIDLPGGVRVSVDAMVDAGALARVLSVLR